MTSTIEEARASVPKSFVRAALTPWDWSLMWVAEALIVLRRRQVWRFARKVCGTRFPRIAAPRSVNEKFAWRKVFDRDPVWTTVSDKLAARDWVARRTSALAFPKVLWTGTDPAGIPPDALRDDVVFKANHASGTNLFIHGGHVDPEALRHAAHAWLEDDYSLRAEEWGYRDIPRRLFVEEVVGDGAPLHELKFYTYGTRILRLIQIVDRFGAKLGCRYDGDGAGGLVNSGEKADVANAIYQGGLPDSFPQAIEAARQLGACFDHARVDFLTDGRTVWFNEITVYNMGGRLSKTGNLRDGVETRAWDLRRSAFLSKPQTGWRALYAASLRRHLEREAARRRGTPPKTPPETRRD